MSAIVAMTQRVAIDSATGERRDCLDQGWHHFLASCGLVALPLPNHAPSAIALVERVRPAGIVLTGGGNVLAYGGDSPERDAVEAWLLDQALSGRLPLLGVCRGMQAIQHRLGVPLERVTGHVRIQHPLALSEGSRVVNSFHNFGTQASVPALDVWARGLDGVIEAVRHASAPVAGIMWHPERVTPCDPLDIALFRDTFGGIP